MGSEVEKAQIRRRRRFRGGEGVDSEVGEGATTRGVAFSEASNEWKAFVPRSSCGSQVRMHSLHAACKGAMARMDDGAVGWGADGAGCGGKRTSLVRGGCAATLRRGVGSTGARGWMGARPGWMDVDAGRMESDGWGLGTVERALNDMQIVTGKSQFPTSLESAGSRLRRRAGAALRRCLNSPPQGCMSLSCTGRHSRRRMPLIT